MSSARVVAETLLGRLLNRRRETGPLLQKQVVAVIDSRTTYICLHAAGQIQPLDADFQTLAGDFTAPPFHRHCRDLIRPYMPGFVDDQRARSNAELQRRPKAKRDWRTYKETVPPPDTETDDDGNGSAAAGAPSSTPPTPTPIGAAVRRSWRGQAGRNVQAALHGRRSWDDESLALAHALDAAMAPTDQPVTVWRAIRGADLDDYQPGTAIVDRGYTAATTDRGNLPGIDRGLLLQVTVPVGTSAVVLETLGEILLARGTAVVITSTIVGTGTPVVQGEAVQP